MINLNHQELSETRAPPLPHASLEVLKSMREDMCSTKSSRDFKLQPSQRFLRRIMSPDSPTRNIMLVHGTGTGKTCSAIQIAEEFIMRPEFQDKRVLILANPSVQENFKGQIFNVSKVSVDKDGLILSKQCTGRKYLDMLERIYSEPLKFSDKAVQEKIMNVVSKLISEFYEFQGYDSFSNSIDKQKLSLKSANVDKWIHDTFDNRLIIVDEAHNLRDTTESTTTPKLVGEALKQILATANGIILVLLTATPMYDQYDELLYYFNLFSLNDREDTKGVETSAIFKKDGTFVSDDKEQLFRGWCQKYISFVKGENPFTFPFRLYPPESRMAIPDRTTDINNKKIMQT
jgi:type I site-specific restriction endonuclease